MHIYSTIDPVNFFIVFYANKDNLNCNIEAITLQYRLSLRNKKTSTQKRCSLLFDGI